MATTYKKLGSAFFDKDVTVSIPSSGASGAYYYGGNLSGSSSVQKKLLDYKVDTLAPLSNFSYDSNYAIPAYPSYFGSNFKILANGYIAHGILGFDFDTVYINGNEVANDLSTAVYIVDTNGNLVKTIGTHNTVNNEINIESFPKNAGFVHGSRINSIAVPNKIYFYENDFTTIKKILEIRQEDNETSVYHSIKGEDTAGNLIVEVDGSYISDIDGFPAEKADDTFSSYAAYVVSISQQYEVTKIASLHKILKRSGLDYEDSNEPSIFLGKNKSVYISYLDNSGMRHVSKLTEDLEIDKDFNDISLQTVIDEYGYLYDYYLDIDVDSSGYVYMSLRTFYSQDYSPTMDYSRRQLVRFNPNGSLDTSFNPYPLGLTISNFEIMSDDSLLVSGNHFIPFAKALYSGSITDSLGNYSNSPKPSEDFYTSKNRALIRLLPDGTIDEFFDISTNKPGTVLRIIGNDISNFSLSPYESIFGPNSDIGNVVLGDNEIMPSQAESPGVHIKTIKRVKLSEIYKKLYEVPFGKEAVVGSIFVANHNDFPVFYDIAIVPDPEQSANISDNNLLISDDIIEENQYSVNRDMITLSQGDEIYVYSSTDESISFNVFGLEKDI